MLIEDISISQILTAVLFIAVLFAVQIYITKNKNSLKGKLASNRRIELAESSRLGPNEKVQILRVDHLEYLYFFSKGNQPVIVALPSDNKQFINRDTTLDIKKKSPTKVKQNLVSNVISENTNETPQSEKKIIQAISAARKKNPKVSFE